jgi:hypothetical protein
VLAFVLKFHREIIFGELTVGFEIFPFRQHNLVKHTALNQSEIAFRVVFLGLGQEWWKIWPKYPQNQKSYARTYGYLKFLLGRYLNLVSIANIRYISLQIYLIKCTK